MVILELMKDQIFQISHLSLFLLSLALTLTEIALKKKKDHDSVSHRETDLASLPPQPYRVVCMRVYRSSKPALCPFVALELGHLSCWCRPQ